MVDPWEKKPVRIVCISDTHSMHEEIDDIPDGDVLVHAGDCLGRGTLFELDDFNYWLGELPHAHKILIAGNHDWCFERYPDKARPLVTNAVYLEESGVTIDGIEFWGSPYTPRFRDWAFNVDRGEKIASHWAKIPETTDVLITHGPPEGIFDEVVGPDCGMSVGCADLAKRIDSLHLKAHIFGHIHEAYGYGVRAKDGVKFANASICDKRYRAIRKPIVIDLVA
ncbi:metallophosphoesterase [Marinobacter santoriniensis NKSG1]|uniref:Metallophosphoesterase n=1 Tax=Marinobacter santoriniensis NKSG1 TaxID=1288826 RepID=M7D8P6_9GAMM|nr:metallophosphatase domain-containing protein [Marinobacter santoriniensis]EMP57098.1 metallophosphoesterase [Marinobacter santoriniensis NKSG1]